MRRHPCRTPHQRPGATCWDDRCLNADCIADQLRLQLWHEWLARKHAEDAAYTAQRDQHRRYWRHGPTRAQKAAQAAEIRAEWDTWIDGRRTA